MNRFIFLLLLFPSLLIAQWDKASGLNNVTALSAALGIGTTTPDSTLEVNGSLVVNNTINYGEDSGSNDTYVVTISGITALIKGQIIIFSANTQNTGAATININGLGAISILKLHLVALTDNCLEGDSMALLVYNGSEFELLQPCAN